MRRPGPAHILRRLRKAHAAVRGFPHPLAWLLAGALAAVDAAWFALTDMSLANLAHAFAEASPYFLLTLLLVALLGSAGALAAAYTTAFFFVFGNAAWIFNHLTASAGLPFADAWLARADAALGLGREAYLAYVGFVNDHPVILEALKTAYGGHKAAFALVIAALAVTNRVERLREFTLLFAITATATVLAGWLLPAAGAFAHYQPAPELTGNLPADAGRYPLPYILPLHAGTLKTIDVSAMPGLVCMPSYHAVMAFMTPWALRGMWAFWPAAAYCVLTIAATPVFGGHFFVDIIAGGALFAASALALRRGERRPAFRTGPAAPREAEKARASASGGR